MDTTTTTNTVKRDPWNKGKLVGQKAPLKLKEIWAIRVRLQLSKTLRDLALFDLAIDSKLRGCDLVKLRVRDIAHGDQVASRAMVMQQKTQRPVQFEITEQTRDALRNWIGAANLRSESFLFPSRLHKFEHLSTRQYVRIVDGWVTSIGLDSSAYGTHTMRRTKASLIYRRTGNLRSWQHECANVHAVRCHSTRNRADAGGARHAHDDGGARVAHACARVRDVPSDATTPQSPSDQPPTRRPDSSIHRVKPALPRRQ